MAAGIVVLADVSGDAGEQGMGAGGFEGPGDLVGHFEGARRLLLCEVEFPGSLVEFGRDAEQIRDEEPSVDALKRDGVVELSVSAGIVVGYRM